MGVAKALPPTLSRRGLVLARIGIVVFALGMALGSVIVAAIAMPNNTLMQGVVGDIANRILAINPMILPLLVNGCFIGVVFCYVRIRDHKKAIELKGKMKKHDE